MTTTSIDTPATPPAATPPAAATPAAAVPTGAGPAYDRLGRTGRHRWWLPVVAAVSVPVAALIAMNVLFLIAFGVAGVLGIAVRDDGTFVHPLVEEGVSLLAIAVLVPLVPLAAWLIQGRPAGTVHSVAGRLRPRWFGLCALVAAVLVGLAQGIGFVLDGGTGGPAVSVGFLVSAVAMYLVLVPLQAAGEEYLFRGWLVQAIGAYAKGRWPAVAISSVLFAAAHGWGGPWGFASLVVMAVCLSWLTIRTGGLEAAIALHVVNNVVAFSVGAWFGEAGSVTTLADATPGQAVAVVAVSLAYLAVVTGLARSRNWRGDMPFHERNAR
jgi:uncharacterized protein